MDDKIARKMLRDRRSFLTQTADKVAVREYVMHLAPNLLSHVHQVVDDAGNLNWGDFPEEVAIKSNHGCSGSVIISRNGTPLPELLDQSGQLPKRWTTYRVSTGGLCNSDYGILEEYLNWLLAQRYGWGSPIAFTFEWAYRNIKPQLLVEELLVEDDQNPIDYRFFVADGEVAWIQRDYKRDGDHFSSVHLPDWTMLNVRYNYDLPPEIPQRPPNLSVMSGAAKTLAAETDFCRVDFYDLHDRVVFGEITHYPRGGNNDFQPREWGVTAGAAWRPPWRYR